MNLPQTFERICSWCMLFAEHLVLVDDARERINFKLDLQIDSLEFKGFSFRRRKT